MRTRQHISVSFLVSFVVTVAVGLVLLGCSKKEPGPAQDGNIAATVAAANTAEVTLGTYAQMKATNVDVKAFATRMVNEHNATLQRQAALFARLGIVPTDNDTSRQLQNDAKTMLDMLQLQAPGPALDLAYLDGQITLHRRVLLILDSELIPGASRDEIRTDLRQMRTDVAAQAQAAQTLRTMLGMVGDGGTGDGGGPRDGGTTDGGPGDGGTADGGTTDGSTPTDGGSADGASLRK